MENLCFWYIGLNYCQTRLEQLKFGVKKPLKQGLEGLYLVRVESFVNNINPETIGFDAAVEFAPDWGNMGPRLLDNQFLRTLAKIGLFP